MPPDPGRRPAIPGSAGGAPPKPALPAPPRRPPRSRGWLPLLALLTPALAAAPAPLRSQEAAEVVLEIQLIGAARSPRVLTRNLLEDTPWLSALRQGLPVRLRYKLELWRSRDAWLDDVEREVEWSVVIRHEPLLDQFSVVRLLPNGVRQNRYATAGALALALGLPYQYTVPPGESGRYYYTASLDVTTLSESDLESFDRLLRGELVPGNGAGGGRSLGERARGLLLRLAGLPTLRLAARSDSFEVER